MAELPILPLKTDALLADTSNLTAEEFGIYCRLLFVMWRHGGKLVNDPDELARIAGVPELRWPRIAGRIMRLMTIGDDGFISQKRLTDTWLTVQEVRRKRTLSAGKRWKKTPNRNANAMQMDMQKACDCGDVLHDVSNANHISKKEREEIYSARAREGPPQAGIRGEIEASPELVRNLIARGWLKAKPG